METYSDFEIETTKKIKVNTQQCLVISIPRISPEKANVDLLDTISNNIKKEVLNKLDISDGETKVLQIIGNTTIIIQD